MFILTDHYDQFWTAQWSIQFGILFDCKSDIWIMFSGNIALFLVIAFLKKKQATLTPQLRENCRTFMETLQHKTVKPNQKQQLFQKGWQDDILKNNRM